ncbi:DUF4267 domain-containing protein [Embleya sp. NBC_00896]|uniref:DUF4267 domain-containing protein n=1 Tax=Embleya sp. NBC_00896 TaxID=2975961 RepID=UPI002F916088|nr:DUF4267 domain-containing protein [Embleya sp. NBC_00896]
MTLKNLTTGLAALGAVFIIYVGIAYLLAPQSSASGFGVPTWPSEDGTAFLAVKGVRDIASGLVIFALLLNGHRKALGWAMAAITFVPTGDMVIVLGHDGSAGTAFGIHGLTAVAVAVTAGLLLRERSTTTQSDRTVTI